MINSPRRLAAALITGGILALVAGAFLTVTVGVVLFSMGGEILQTWVSYVGIFEDPRPRPMPELHGFWPSVGLIAGISLFLVGWVAIIRGVAHGWPTRMDRSPQ